MNRESSTLAAGPLLTLAIVVSAAGALVAMYVIGHRQRSLLLIGMFVVWVLSPYMGLGILIRRARAWNPSARTVVQSAALAISVVALGRYAWVVVWPLKAQPASTFMIVPLLSWIAIGVAVVVARSAKRSN